MPWTKDAGWVRWGSQSNPELGKNGNPLIGYAPRHPIPVSISEDEQEAEQLYYSLASSTITKHAFTSRANDLTRRSQDAGSYLTWLVHRGATWPRVKSK